MRKNGFFLGMGLTTLLQACGSGAPEADGVLTVVNQEPVVIRDSEVAKRVCETSYCEPNYIVYASFAKRRPPDRWVVPPTPAPEPRREARASARCSSRRRRRSRSRRRC